MPDRSTAEKHWTEDLGPNDAYIQEMYRLYTQDPSLVGETWSSYFSGLNGGSVQIENGFTPRRFRDDSNGSAFAVFCIGAEWGCFFAASCCGAR